MDKYFSMCGLYCGACSLMILYEKALGDPLLVDFSVEYNDSPCQGCKGGANPECEFVICNREHNTECCSYCQEFPCEMILKFSKDEWPHHKDVIENLETIRDTGKENWLREQKKLWSCSDCGNRTHWYQTECDKCGKSWPCRY